MGHHWNSHRRDNLGALIHTAAQAAASMAVAGMNSAKAREEVLKQARVQWPQTCVEDARQRMIASDSCCCNPEGSRSCFDYRTENLAATAHAMAVRCDPGTEVFALARVS